MKIIGIGVDLCDVRKIEKLYKKFDKFASKILCNELYEKFSTLSLTDRAMFLAKHWAVSEAIAKATKLGLAQLRFHNVYFFTENGAPYAKIKNRPEITLEISISHENEYVIATALAYSNQ